MKKTIILLYFLSTFSLFSELIINSNQNEIIIKLNNLEKMVINNYDQLKLFTSFDTLGNFNSLIFPIALQKDNDFHLSYKVYSYKATVIEFETQSNLALLEKIHSSIRRNVKIARLKLNPFLFENGTPLIADSLEIKISFTYPINTFSKSNKKLFEYEKSFFRDIINPEHLPAILDNSSIKQQIYPQSANWYNPKQKYLKIETNKFSIAAIDGLQILSLIPEWENKPVDAFHLLYMGMDYPIYISSDNQFFNSKSKIYFLSRAAQGDTTYLDFYTDKAVFYLFVDDNKTPVRLSLFPEVTATNSIQIVEIDYHIELDKEYFGGTNDIYSRQDYLEGWYWAKIHRFKEWWEEQLFGFKHYFPILPSENDSLRILYRFATLNISLPGIGLQYRGKDPLQKYFFHTIFNKDTANATFVNQWTDSIISFSVAGNNIYNGLNELKILNRRVDSSNGLLGVDFFRFQGKVKPFPTKGFIQFDIKKLQQPSNLTIPGFNSSNVVLLDTINKLISFSNGVEGFRFAASAGSQANTLVINDTCVYIDSGFVFAYHNFSEIRVLIFNDNISSNVLSSIYNQLPDNSLVLFANNMRKTLPSDVRSFFQSIGSNEMSNYSSDKNWVFASLKGKSEKFEKLSNNIASINGFFAQKNAGSFQINFDFEADKNYSIFLNSFNSIQIPVVSLSNETDLPNENKGAELIIVSHNKFFEKAKQYSEYKASKGVSNILVDVDDIYKEFNYGKISPLAIKKYLLYAYQNWEIRPKYLLLIGDASWDSRKVLAGSRSDCFIPSFGWPVSDYWFGLLDGEDFDPEVIVGRIPAQTKQEVANYIEKAIAFENQPNARWMKKFLFLSGGDSELQRRSFASYRYNVFDKVEPYPICAETAWVGIKNFNAGSEEQKNEILSHLNSGTIWTFFFGHASSQVFDLDGWHVEYMNNKGRTGFLSTLSCNAGAFAEPLDFHGRNESYVLAKDNGFVITYGSTGVGMVEGALSLMTYMVDGFSDYRIALRRAGDILLYGTSRLDPSQWVYYVTRDLVSLLGDPTLSIRLGYEPDLFIPRNEISISNQNNETVLSETEKYATVKGRVYNNGYAQNNPLYVRLIRKYENQADTLFQHFNLICNIAEFEFQLPIENLPGEHSIEILAQSDFFVDKNFSDNSVNSTFFVYSQNIIPIDPQANWNVTPHNLVFRFINFFDKEQAAFYLDILSVNDKDTNIIASSEGRQIFVYDGYLDWKPEIELEANKSYVLRYKVLNLSTGTSSYYSFLPFYTSDNQLSKTQIKITDYSDFSNFQFDGTEISDDKIKIKNPKIHFSLLGLNGYPTGELDSWVNITLGNDVYIDHRYYRGFNVVVVPKNQRLPKGRYYRFDTWELPDDARNLVRLLRDSVTNDDYVLIATCNQSFRAFEELVPNTDFAYIDSLRLLLKDLYHSNLAEQLASNKSFVYAGGKSSNQIWESINDFDSAMVEGYLEFYSLNGNATYSCVSPAKRWGSIKITGYYDEPENIETQLTFFSSDNSLSLDTTLLGTGLFSLSNVSSEKFPFLKINLSLKKSHYLDDIFIDDVTIDLEPSEELLLLPNSHISFPNILRGDTNEIQLNIKNLSLRSNSGNIKAQIAIKDQFNASAQYQFTLDTIKVNETLPFVAKIPTDNFSGTISIQSSITSSHTERFLFNNIRQTNFNTREDTVRPWIIAKFDDKIVKNGDYISNSPLISVELYDNSLLPVVRQNDLRVRINGVMQTPERCKYYQLETFGNTRPLKAKLTIIPDTLRELDNSVLIYFSDASSNRDTVKYFLKISKNGEIKDNLIYPNPSKYKTNLKFYLLSPENNQSFTIYFYNSFGQKIRQFSFIATIGENILSFDNVDDQRNLLPNGVYFYSIISNNSIYYESVFGKFLINY